MKENITRFEVEAYAIGEYEFRNLLGHLSTDESMKLIADCAEGDHQDYDCLISYDIDIKHNCKWIMVMTNGNGLRVVGVNNIMQKVWGEGAKPFKAYNIPKRMAYQFGYLDDPIFPIRYAIG